MTHPYKPQRTVDIGLPAKLDGEAPKRDGENHDRFEYYRHFRGVNKTHMAHIFDVHPVTMRDWWDQDDKEHKAGKPCEYLTRRKQLLERLAAAQGDASVTIGALLHYINDPAVTAAVKEKGSL